MKQNITKKIIQILFMVTLFVAGTSRVFAVKIIAEVPKVAPDIGTSFLVNVVLDAQGDSVNALSGSLLIPRGYVVQRVIDRDSIVTLWVKKPVTGNAGTMELSGIITGGFAGLINPFSPKIPEPGNVITLVITHAGIGAMDFAWSDVHAYANDGQGAELQTIAEIIGADTGKMANLSDIQMPEPFEPVIVHDSLIGNGYPAIVFHTTDAGSGIDYYAVKIGEGDWITTDSPYVFETKKIAYPVSVKAVDLVGNERIAMLQQPTEIPLTRNIPWTMIVIVAIVAVLIIIGVRKLLQHGNINFKK